MIIPFDITPSQAAVLPVRVPLAEAPVRREVTRRQLSSDQLFAGSFGALLFQPRIPTLGASTAILGIFGALIVVAHARRIPIWQSGLMPVLLLNFVLSFLNQTTHRLAYFSAAPGVQLFHRLLDAFNLRLRLLDVHLDALAQGR